MTFKKYDILNLDLVRKRGGKENMKKIFLAIGILVLVFIILNLINIKSNFSYPVSDSAQINVKAGAGNLNFGSTSNKSTVSGYFSHKIFSKVEFNLASNNLALDSSKVNGEVNLPSDISFSNISLTLGAGNLDLNLKESKVDNFFVTSGASNVKLTLPQNSSSKFNFVIGAGNLSLVVPTSGELDGIKIISTSLSNMNLGDLWVKVADGIETKDFNKAKVTSIIDLSKGGSVNLDITAEK